MRLIVSLVFVNLLFYVNGLAQAELTPTLGGYVEWLELKVLQGTQTIELPPKAFTLGALIELAPPTVNGFIYRFSGGYGVGIGKPSLKLMRFDTSVLHVFPFSNIKIFGDIGMGLLQLESHTDQFWKTVGWIGGGLRVNPLRLFVLAFEIKILGLLQLEYSTPLPVTWIFRLEAMWGRF
jgi:hypothetical protein